MSTRQLATNFVSPGTWLALVGSQAGPMGVPDVADVGFVSVATIVLGLILATWLLGSICLWRTSSRTWMESLATWGLYGTVWWCLLDLWEWIWIGAGIVGWQSLMTLLSATPQFWLAFCASGWVATLACLNTQDESPDAEASSSPASIRWVLLSCGVYIVIFTTMNWQLYFNLLIPHGDSAMYEEHLWNVLHGKGFRSYLDQGLFLGEHIQFVHLFLIPLYLIWPSHLLLELLESSALALGAVPLFWMVRRHSGSDRTAIATAVAYLLYTPMQFLDIEIDLKTFRPEAFGIPLLLLTLDQLDRRNIRGLLIGILFTLTVKEDYALVFGPLGLWIIAHELWSATRRSVDRDIRRRWLIVGIAISVGSVVYLWLAMRVVMPWFRSGAEVHYASYFSKFGKSPEEILGTMLSRPGLLFDELFSTATILYMLAMLAPVGFLAFFSPGRLAVGAPLFGILCLNDLAKDPRHHFHAPLVAIVFWAIAGGIPHATTCLRAFCCRFPRLNAANRRASSNVPRVLLVTSALTTGVFLSLGPLGLSFWDPGSNWNWKRLYVPNRRSELFARVIPLIPTSSRVASTDFIHPRFTHHERSYDYSAYLRKVSQYERQVPEDTDFIVIDTQHPYSTLKTPEDVPEYRDQPDQWELLPDTTEGYFIILKRRDTQERREVPSN
jgi:uncharacterized membrane protein